VIKITEEENKFLQVYADRLEKKRYGDLILFHTNDVQRYDGWYNNIESLVPQ